MSSAKLEAGLRRNPAKPDSHLEIPPLTSRLPLPSSQVDRSSCPCLVLRELFLENFTAKNQFTENRPFGQTRKGVRWMPWRFGPKKDVASCDKPRGAASRLRSVDLRMGQPGEGKPSSSCAEYIGAGRAPGELKHLSTRRKRKQPRSPE